jgi:hypothetical protein
MSKVKKETSTGSESRVAFVISPIGEPDSPERKRADQILKYVIEPAVQEFGYKTLRADKDAKPGIITSQVINHLINEPLVVADLTGHNPNVFYELAVRHATRKPVIQLIQKGEKIPFDVAAQRTIEVDNTDLDSVNNAIKELRRQIKAVERDPTLVDSPISASVDFQSFKQSGNPQIKIMTEMRDTLSQLVSRVGDLDGRLSPSRLLTSMELLRREHRYLGEHLTPEHRVYESYVLKEPKPRIIEESPKKYRLVRRAKKKATNE